MLNKDAALVETLLGTLPRMAATGQRISGAMTHSAPYQKLIKALEGKMEQRALKQLQESAADAVTGPYPGTMQLPGGQIIASKGLEAAGVPLAQQMGKTKALKDLGM